MRSNLTRSKSAETPKPDLKKIDRSKYRSKKVESNLSQYSTIFDELTPKAESKIEKHDTPINSFFTSITQKNVLTFEDEEQNYEDICRSLGVKQPIKNCDWGKTYSLIKSNIFYKVYIMNSIEIADLVQNKKFVTESGTFFKNPNHAFDHAIQKFTKKDNFDLVRIFTIKVDVTQNNFKYLALKQDSFSMHDCLMLENKASNASEPVQLTYEIESHESLKAAKKRKKNETKATIEVPHKTATFHV